MAEQLEYLEYRTLSLQGSHYDIGQQLAQKLNTYQRLNPRLISSPRSLDRSGFTSFKEILELYDSYCPGIVDEMQGFIDTANTSIDTLAIFDLPKKRSYNCSQFAVLDTLLGDKTTYVGRSYDYHYSDEDLILAKTQVTGKYSHLGFTMNGFGRPEGINSAGLVITMAGGGAWDAEWTNFKSFHYYIAIRSLLESCASVEKAVDKLVEMPVATSTNYLLVDKNNTVALVEGFDSQFAVKYISDAPSRDYLFSTNYYKEKKMLKYNEFINSWLMECNKIRERVLENVLATNNKKLTKQDLLSLLKNEIPNGLSTLFFSEWFGTLWSMLFDLKTKSVDVCFGPPSLNEYHSFSLDDPMEERVLTVKIANKQSNFNL